MYITISIIINDKNYDIRVDNRQRIYECIKILKSKIRSIDDTDIHFFKSYINNRTVSKYLTFEEAGIFSGDILSGVK